MFDKSSNPAFKSKALEDCTATLDRPMTINGTIGKTFILLGIAVLSGAISINAAMNGANPGLLVGAGCIVAFILALITIFKPMQAKIFAPFYAMAEGVALGITTMIFEVKYPGIALQAVALTVLSLVGMLFLYRFNIIRATEKFRSTIIMAMFAIVFLYIINFIGHWVSFLHIPMITDSSPLGIGFSLIICLIASLNFIIDFDNIENGANSLLHKDLEWYFSFGLMVTLVWLYVEILRLLAKFRER